MPHQLGIDNVDNTKNLIEMIFALLLSWVVKISDWVNPDNISAVFVFFTTLFAMLFGYYRLKNERLKAKLNEEELKQKRKENEREEDN